MSAVRGWRPALALALLAGCATPPEKPSLLLISIDTLRADHLGCYGYGRATSPHLDAFARAATRFETAYAPAPWTLPSHATMLTGIHAWDLGFSHPQAMLPEGVTTVAAPLAAAGYQTAAFVDSGPEGFVGAERGFDRGFAEYHHGPHRVDGRKGRKHDAAATVDAALAWLRGREAGRPFFLFLHTKSVHAVPMNAPCEEPRCLPYDKPEPYRSRFLRPAAGGRVWSEPGRGHGQAYLWSLNRAFQAGEADPRAFPRADAEALAGLYDGGIAYTDEQLGRLLAELAPGGLLAGTAVVVTSDHGEGFLEHDLLLHQEVYEPLVRVPLLLKAPGQSGGGVIAAPVSLEDVAPTLLAFAGLPPPAGATGFALPPLGTPPAERPFFAYYLFSPPFDYRARSLRLGRFKVVEHNFGRGAGEQRAELYDLERDPGETAPLVGDPVALERLRALLAARLKGPGRSPRRLERPGWQGRLEAVGYLD